MPPLLSIDNLSVSFSTDEGKVHAVDKVSLSLERGEALGLVGESGSGKSVTALSILRLIPSPPGSIDSGTITFCGQDLLKLPVREMRAIRGKQISMIFQDPMTALSPLHRIGPQLVETLQFHSRIGRNEAWQIGEEWLHKVGIPDPAERMHAYPYQLSGGMRQRVMIAMALMLDPNLFIADEPTTALDTTIQAQIIDLIKAARKKETSTILITHDMGIIWSLCSRVAVMYASEIVEIGPRDEIFNNPLHPYTKALIATIPSSNQRKKRLTTIAGQVPSPLAYPTGCRFRDRCHYAMKSCATDHPTLQDHIDHSHRVACWLHHSPPKGD